MFTLSSAEVVETTYEGVILSTIINITDCSNDESVGAITVDLYPNGNEYSTVYCDCCNETIALTQSVSSGLDIFKLHAEAKSSNSNPEPIVGNVHAERIAYRNGAIIRMISRSTGRPTDYEITAWTNIERPNTPGENIYHVVTKELSTGKRVVFGLSPNDNVNVVG